MAGGEGAGKQPEDRNAIETLTGNKDDVDRERAQLYRRSNPASLP